MSLSRASYLVRQSHNRAFCATLVKARTCTIVASTNRTNRLGRCCGVAIQNGPAPRRRQLREGTRGTVLECFPMGKVGRTGKWYGLPCTSFLERSLRQHERDRRTSNSRCRCKPSRHSSQLSPLHLASFTAYTHKLDCEHGRRSGRCPKGQRCFEWLPE